MISSMLERIYLDNPASDVRPRTKVGNRRCRETSTSLIHQGKGAQFMDERPEMGSHPSLSPKTIMAKRATAYVGTENPRKTKRVARRSNRECCLMAAKKPIGIARSSIRPIERTFKSR